MEKNFEEQVNEYEEQLRVNPNDLEALRNLGILYVANSVHNKLENKYQQYIKLNPKSSEILSDFANFLVKNNKKDEAIMYYREALAIDSNNVEVLRKLANYLDSEGKYEEAIFEYEKYLEINPNHMEILFSYGNFLLNNEDESQALIQYNKLLILDRRNIEPLRRYANYLTEKKRFEEAFTQYEKALSLDVSNINLYRNYINSLLKKGKFLEADEKLDYILNQFPEEFSIVLQIYLNRLLKKYQEIETINKLNYLLTTYPDNHFILGTYAEVLEKLNDYEAALIKYEEAITLPIVDVSRKIYILYGKLLIKVERHEEGFEKFNKVLELKPTSSVLKFYTQSLIKLGYFERTLGILAKVLEVNPKEIRALNSYGHTLMKLGKYREALEKFALVLKINPKEITALNSYGHTLMKLGKYKEALEKFALVLKINPKEITALNSYGHTLMKLGKYKEALEKFESILVFQPTNKTAFSQKQSILEKVGSDRRTILLKSYEQGLFYNSNNIKVLNAYGKLLAEMGEFKKSFIQFEKLLKINSNDIIALYSYGQVLIMAKEYEKSFEKFEKILKINSNDSQTYFAYAKALEHNSQVEKAIEKMQEIRISIIPENNKNVFYLYIGKLYFIAKRYTLAEKAFKEIQSKSKSQKNALKNIMQELISSEVKSKNILKNLGDFIEGFDKKDLDSISHIFSMEELFKFYDDEELESKLQEEKELNSTIFHKLENHINLIRLTFDLVIKKNYSDESTKISTELKERTTTIFKKIKIMREEQKKLDDEIGESLEEIEKKLNLIGEDIADKINNELSLLRVKIDLAQKKDLISEKIFSKLKKQIATSSAIADNLRIINKSTNIVISSFKIKDIFENIEDKMTLQNATLSLNIKNEENSFEGDKNRIKEIISELIENSIRHNSDRELLIDIISEDSENSKINGIKHNGKYLYIKFNDNGIGVDEDKKEWIFLPTKTTSSEGSGLGLYIIRKTIKSMNGFIIENGTYEKGVQFEIFIPYKK